MKKLSIIFFVALFVSGCVLTKVVTVPLRVSGAVVSVVPFVGNQIDEVIDDQADAIDDLPLFQDVFLPVFKTLVEKAL